jgi:two-component system response regulator HydG
MAALERYRWPGNVRELQNVIERACALADAETICQRDLPDHVLGVGEVPPASARAGADAGMPEPGTDLTLKDAKERWMAVLEASYLRDLLARNDGNISAAAKAAGIDRKTFHRLINKHDLK